MNVKNVSFSNSDSVLVIPKFTIQTRERLECFGALDFSRPHL